MSHSVEGRKGFFVQLLLGDHQQLVELALLLSWKVFSDILRCNWWYPFWFQMFVCKSCSFQACARKRSERWKRVEKWWWWWWTRWWWWWWLYQCVRNKGARYPGGDCLNIHYLYINRLSNIQYISMILFKEQWSTAPWWWWPPWDSSTSALVLSTQSRQIMNILGGRLTLWISDLIIFSGQF